MNTPHPYAESDDGDGGDTSQSASAPVVESGAGPPINVSGEPEQPSEGFAAVRSPVVTRSRDD